MCQLGIEGSERCRVASSGLASTQRNATHCGKRASSAAIAALRFPSSTRACLSTQSNTETLNITSIDRGRPPRPVELSQIIARAVQPLAAMVDAASRPQILEHLTKSLTVTIHTTRCGLVRARGRWLARRRERAAARCAPLLLHRPSAC